MKLADFRAFAAKGTGALVHLWDQNADFLAGFERRIEEETGGGRFHVAIHEANRLLFSSDQRQAGSDGCFACPAFAASNHNTH